MNCFQLILIRKTEGTFWLVSCSDAVLDYSYWPWGSRRQQRYQRPQGRGHNQCCSPWDLFV